MICGVYSPLAKVFQPSYKSISKDGKVTIISLESLVENPERIMSPKEDPFSIFVPRAFGSLEFTYMKPKQITDPLVLEWLTATRTGGAGECDTYGVVPFNIKVDAFAEAVSAIEGEEEDIRERRKSDIMDSLELAKAQSTEKLMRAVRGVVETIKKEHERLGEEGKGRAYMPSNTEILCTFILSDEMAKISAKRKSTMDKFKLAMDGAFEKL
jgi:hypothetical protein